MTDSLDDMTHKLFPKYEPTSNEELDKAVWAELKAKVKESLVDLDGNLARTFEDDDE
jgi:hypothetical protein